MDTIANANNKFKEFYYANFFDFFKDLMIDNKYGEISDFIFRGQSNSKWLLLPYAIRKKGKDLLKKFYRYTDKVDTKFWPWLEVTAVCEFYNKSNQNALLLPAIEELICTINNELPDSANYKGKRLERKYFELFALAQHYGIPTRFIDWTYDIFIALYFAINSAKDSSNESRVVRDEFFSIWMLNSFLTSGCKEYNINLVTPRYSINPNLAAQKGVLSYINLKDDQSSSLEEKQKQLEEENKIQSTPLTRLIKKATFYDPILRKEKRIIGDQTLLYKFNFPKSVITETHKFLLNMGYTKSRIFPGFHSILEDMSYDI